MIADQVWALPTIETHVAQPPGRSLGLPITLMSTMRRFLDFDSTYFGALVGFGGLGWYLANWSLMTSICN
jgi:hypothetical protein